MGVFTRLMDRIFRSKTAQARETPVQQSQLTPQPQPRPQAQPQQGAGSVASPPQGQAAVDVEAVLTELAAKNPQKLNWRSSIVDLMKLLDMDSSLGERKELAQELGYKGDMGDSATMNIWLHKQVMQKLAQNGGKVPAELLN